MASLGAEGAVVSTSNELAAILKAIVHGNLISRDSFENMAQMRGRIWPGVSYGIGLMNLSVRNSWNPTTASHEMLGHLGATGSFMLWLPRQDVFLAGHSGQLLGQKATRKMLRGALSFLVPKGSA
jgi:CubicO group peptidase (beta-lactamase class C family)